MLEGRFFNGIKNMVYFDWGLVDVLVVEMGDVKVVDWIIE